jgi:hypothetical protein
MTAAARLRLVARMLLCISSRTISICALSLMSACVLPIGPDFQDPLSSPNYAPYFVDTLPLAGSIVTATSTVPQFRVTVQDPNGGDDLQVRWIADYPPFTDNTRVILTTPILHAASGVSQPQDAFVTPNCTIDSLAKIPSHQLYVVVADRPFLDPVAGEPVDVEALPPDGRKDSRSWTLDLDCSQAPQ